MLRRFLIAAACAGALLTAAATPAAAIPPGGDQLLVINYFSGGDRQTLIGQKWRGCPGQNPGQWGQTSKHMSFHTVPC